MSGFFNRLVLDEESNDCPSSHDAGVADARAWARLRLAETGGRPSPRSSEKTLPTGFSPRAGRSSLTIGRTTGRHPYSRLGSPAASFGLSAYLPCPPPTAGSQVAFLSPCGAELTGPRAGPTGILGVSCALSTTMSTCAPKADTRPSNIWSCSHNSGDVFLSCSRSSEELGDELALTGPCLRDRMRTRTPCRGIGFVSKEVTLLTLAHLG